jgi:hypothetical protein
VIEQLHYTWSEQGLQGHARYQVTAASPGLADLSGEKATLARRLCRKPGGDSKDAVSFGWIDARGHRFVFRRIAAGVTADGRPDRFAAHVLVAPIGLITVPDLLHRQCRTGLWWSGEPEESQSLPCLNPQPLCPWISPEFAARTMASRRCDDLALTLAHLLTTAGTGQVPGTWQEVLTAAAWYSSVIMASFGAISSFSTLEQGETSDWFQLVGTGDKAPPRGQPLTSARAAANLILSRKEEEIRLARAAADATEKDSQLPWREFTALAAAFSALVAEGTVDCAELLPSLSKPGTADEVLRIRRGRSVVVDALLANRDDVAIALDKSAHGINRDLLREVGIELAERKLARESSRPPGPATWRVLMRVARPLGAPGLDGLAVVALQPPVADGSSWPKEILQACLRSTALKPDMVPALAKAAADRESLAPILTDPEIPLAYRADVAVTALNAGTLSPPDFIQQSGARGDLVDPTVTRLARQGKAGDVLTALPPTEAVHVLSRIARDLQETSLLAACESLLPRLALENALDLVISLNELTWSAQANEWAAIADNILLRAVRAQLNDTLNPLAPAHLIRVCSRSQKGKAWRSLLSATAFQAGADVAAVAGALRAHAITSHPDARGYAVQAVLPLVMDEDVPAALNQLLGTIDIADLHSAIDAAGRYADTQGIPSLARAVIGIIARYEKEDHYVLHACGRLARNHLDSSSWKILNWQFKNAPRAVRGRLKLIHRLSKYPNAVPPLLQRLTRPSCAPTSLKATSHG